MADWLGTLPSSWWARGVDAAEAGRVPDFVLRAAIRRLCRTRLVNERANGRTSAEFAERMATATVATHTDLANEQHYEVPTDFFLEVLGPALKYSACEYPHPQASLAEAERHTLALVCERAGIEDGMDVLDLGCGWGSFTTWVAEHVRAHAELGRALRPDRRGPPSRRRLLPARLLSSGSPLLLRGRRRGRLDGAELLLGRDHAEL